MALALSWPAANLFGVRWDDLALPDVQRFLASASGEEHEGLTWEAKAGRIRPEHIHRAVSAFANSVLGGYLILGAYRSDPHAPWTTPGCEIPGPEPRLWIAQTASALIGGPLIDSHAWDAGNGTWIAVVAIPPSSVPPVIAPSGVTYERVTGASPPITDPVRLAQVFARGDAARERAKVLAATAQAELPYQDLDLFANISLGLAATGTPTDVRIPLFTAATQTALEALVLGGATPPNLHRADTNGTARSLRVERVRQFHPGGPLIEVRVSGGVAVAWRDTSELDIVSELPMNPWRLIEVWHLAHEALATIGGYGPAYLTLYIHGHGATHYQGWTRGEGPTDDEVAAIVRHTQRERGAIVHEDPP